MKRMKLSPSQERQNKASSSLLPRLIIETIVVCSSHEPVRAALTEVSKALSFWTSSTKLQTIDEASH